jgi:hypothetical protein
VVLSQWALGWLLLPLPLLVELLLLLLLLVVILLLLLLVVVLLPLQSGVGHALP